MIAIDTGTLIAYLAGDAGPDCDTLDLALAHNEAYLPPVVVSEILSASNATEELTGIVLAIPTLAILDGYWERAGVLRRSLLGRGVKSALADTLICQSCLDHDVPLLTRDGDFRHFVRLSGLRVA